MGTKYQGESLIGMTRAFCDDAHAKDVESFFTPERLAKVDGGPRVLSAALEGIRLCAVKRQKQEPSAREMFGKQRKP
jgi:hypothetical protein